MHSRGHAWGACVVGGMHGRGCAWQGQHGQQEGHAWQGACMAGSMHGRGMAGACMVGACMVGGMHGRVCMAGGMHCRGACVVGGGVRGRYHEIWSMSKRYASYCNAFLFSHGLDRKF